MSARVLLVLPLVLPLGVAVVSLPLPGRAQRRLAIASMAALLLAALALLRQVHALGPLATQVGAWTAPFGITLVADLLSAVMVALAALVGLAVALVPRREAGAGRVARGHYPLVHLLIAGVAGAFLTGDLFNLYVCFEVLLLASFVLLALGGRRPEVAGAVKYVVLNLIASAFFLTAAGLLYGLAGTLNLADLSVRLREVDAPGSVAAVSALLLVAFGIKAGAFPLFMWLPSSYPTPPAAVSALFAGLLTKVGVYALLRVFTLVFPAQGTAGQTLVLGAALLTMLTGVLGAVAQTEFRRVLSWHVISQVGYMLLGLGLLTELALAGTVFYLIHHIVVKANLFLVAGAVERRAGSGRLERSGGLYAAQPLLSLLFLVPALSLAGLPPLSGFWAKLLLVKAALDAHAWTSVVLALAVSLLTLVSMTKLWAEAFWKAAPEPPHAARLPQDGRTALVPIALLAAVTVAIGLGVGPVFELSQSAARQLLDPSAYVAAVLAGGK